MTARGEANGKIRILQAIRAFAAIAVLVYHAAGAANKHGGPMPPIDLTRLGSAGVDIFFVLSGFIILHATVGRGRSCRDYALARFRRIYLPYWPAGLIMAFITLIVMPNYGGLPRWVASVALIPVGEPALDVAWTLQHEVVFYALVAAGFYTGWWRIGLAVWGAAILVFALSDSWSPVGLQVVDSEFLMGVMAWFAWKNARPTIMTASSLILAMLAILLLTVGQNIGVDRAVSLAIAPGFAAMLPWLVLAEQNGRIRTHRFVDFLGSASYSIYLVHTLPLLFLVPIMRESRWYVVFPVMAFAGLAAGIAYHLLVERPLLAWRQKS